MIRFLGTGIPLVQVLEDLADDGRFINDGDEAHGVAAFRAFEGVDFVYLLDEPSPVRSLI